MTREEAKSCIKQIKFRGYLRGSNPFYEQDTEALEMAIKALSQEPTFDDECQKDMDEAWEQIQKKRKRIPVTLDLTPCADAVSRDAVLEKMADYVASGYADSAEDFEEYSRIICQLPSVTQKSGKWIKTPKAVMGEGYMWYCSECEYEVYQDSSRNYPSENFCPNCGAKMESEDKG